MKNLFLTCLALIIFSLSATAQNNSDNNWTADKNQKIFHAIESGDVEDVGDVIDENIVDHSMQGEVHGLDSLKQMFIDLHSHIDHLKFDPIASANDGEYNFTLVRITGTTNSEFMGMPANSPIDATSIDLIRVQNGKAVEHWDYMSPGQAQQMMHMNMMNGNHK